MHTHTYWVWSVVTARCACKGSLGFLKDIASDTATMTGLSKPEKVETVVYHNY